MIIEFIFNLLIDFLCFLTSPLANLSFNIQLDNFSFFFDILALIMYILPPFEVFIPMITLSISIYALRIFIAIYHLIPLKMT